MKPIKEYYCDKTPTHDELLAAHNTCMMDNCIVKLCWYINFHGWEERYIFEDTDIEKLNDSLRHIVYGL